jgi:Acetyltransferase (GNAT) family
MTFGIEIRYATPDDADGIAALYDWVYHGGYPVRECTDPALVRQIVTNREQIWVLALDGDTVVGAIVARHEPGSESYEICRGAVRPDYRGRASYGTLFDLSHRAAVERPDCEIIYLCARSERSRRICCRVRPPWSWTGTDGGMHPVAGEREEHLFGMAFNPERVVTRIVPPRSILIEDSAVAQEITVLNSVTRIGDYPSQIAAGGAAEFTYESDCGRVSFSVLEPSRAAVIGAVEGDAPDDIHRVLWEVIDGAAPSKIEHMTVYVLADKLPVIAALCRAHTGDSKGRFAVRGYLPGWHKEGDVRYDCVALAVCTGEQIPKRLGFEDRIEAIYRSFPAKFG